MNTLRPYFQSLTNMDHNEECCTVCTSGSEPGTGAGKVSLFCLSFTLALCFRAFSEKKQNEI